MAFLLGVGEDHIGNILDAIQASTTLIFLIGIRVGRAGAVAPRILEELLSIPVPELGTVSA
jgi:hypothetical protein